MSSISKDAKICIIGGGPAGLSAGMYLEQKGYENYTILEKEDHVGGKCHSPEYEGRRYEIFGFSASWITGKKLESIGVDGKRCFSHCMIAFRCSVRALRGFR